MPLELCTKCRQVFDHWPDVLQSIEAGEDFVEYIHWENVVYLQKSADRCIVCAQLLYQFSNEDLDEALRIMPYISPVLKLMVLSDRTIDDSESKDFWRLSLYLPLEEGPALAEISLAPAEDEALELAQKIPPVTVCEETLSLARRWLNDCSSSHTRCTTHGTFTKPTRLVAFGQATVHLAESKELPENSNYATLSHCWGSLQILKLQKANFETLRVEIPEDKLCKTFKDAIHIAKQLGFQYLWIDSLCIIQDDEEDWRQESALMSNVYGGSSLNIAASSASDGSVGCVFERNPRPIQRLRVPLPVRGHQKLYDCADYTIYRRCVSQTPLCQRAWVLQERVLAPRTLHLSATQLFWECKDRCACETFPDRLPLRFHKGIDGLLKENASQLWQSLLFRYTEAQLTYSKDRLVAISGIARWISSQTGDEWIAGLWKRNLVTELCWDIGAGRQAVGRTYGEKRKKAFRPRVYQAPSWSWASVECGTIHMLKSSLFHNLIEILEVHMTTAGADPFGLVQDGYIRLRCGDVLCGIDASTRTSWGVLFGKENFHIIPVLDEPRKEGEVLYFLPMAEDSSAYGSIRGMILAPTNLEPGQFRRIGMFSVFWKDISDFKRAMKTPEHFAGKHSYAASSRVDELQEYRHVITLV